MGRSSAQRLKERLDAFRDDVMRLAVAYKTVHPEADTQTCMDVALLEMRDRGRREEELAGKG